MAMTNAAPKITPLEPALGLCTGDGPCDGCEHDVTEDEVSPYRVETRSGQEFVAQWCPECRALAMSLDEDIKAIREMDDTECSEADYDAFPAGYEPERIVIALDSLMTDQIAVLAAPDDDTWWIASVHHAFTGEAIDFDVKLESLIKDKLNERRAAIARALNEE